jgi:hypothetical protein
LQKKHEGTKSHFIFELNKRSIDEIILTTLNLPLLLKIGNHGKSTIYNPHCHIIICPGARNRSIWLGHSLRCTENWKLNPEFSVFSFQFCSKTLAAGTFLDWKLNLEFSVHWIPGPWTWSRGLYMQCRCSAECRCSMLVYAVFLRDEYILLSTFCRTSSTYTFCIFYNQPRNIWTTFYILHFTGWINFLSCLHILHFADVRLNSPEHPRSKDLGWARLLGTAGTVVLYQVVRAVRALENKISSEIFPSFSTGPFLELNIWKNRINRAGQHHVVALFLTVVFRSKSGKNVFYEFLF